MFELEERDVMDCLWDDELTKWEEVSKDEDILKNVKEEWRQTAKS